MDIPLPPIDLIYEGNFAGVDGVYVSPQPAVFFPAPEPRGGGVVKKGPNLFSKPYIRIRNQPCPPTPMRFSAASAQGPSWPSPRPGPSALQVSYLRGSSVPLFPPCSLFPPFPLFSASVCFRAQWHPFRCLPRPHQIIFIAPLEGSLGRNFVIQRKSRYAILGIVLCPLSWSPEP